MKTLKANLMIPAAMVLAAQAGCAVYNDECTRFMENPEGTAFYLDGDVNISRSEVRVRDNSMGQAVADAYYNAFNSASQRATAAIVNGGSIREDGQCKPNSVLKKGAIKRKVLRDVLAFDNQLVLTQVTYSSLKKILEHGIADHSLTVPKGSYLQVAGLKVTVDCSRQSEKIDSSTGRVATAGERVTSIRIRDPNCTSANEDDCYGSNILGTDGSVIATGTVYMALEDYILNGNDQFQTEWFGGVLETAPNYNFEIAAKYLAATFTKDSPMHRIPQERVTLVNCEASNLTEPTN